MPLISRQIVISAGTVKVGGVLSSTLMVCTWVVVLPQSSVRVHVLVMISSPSHARGYNISERGIKRGVAVVCLVSYITRDADAGVIAAGGILVDRDICRDCKRRRRCCPLP